MSKLIAIYRAHESFWIGACRWAKDNEYPTSVTNETCFKGINHRATMFYADDPVIVDEYAVKGVKRLTDEQLMGIDDAE